MKFLSKDASNIILKNGLLLSYNLHIMVDYIMYKKVIILQLDGFDSSQQLLAFMRFKFFYVCDLAYYDDEYYHNLYKNMNLMFHNTFLQHYLHTTSK